MKKPRTPKGPGIAVNDVVQISGLNGPLLKVLAIDENGVHCGWYIHFVSGISSFVSEQGGSSM